MTLHWCVLFVKAEEDQEEGEEEAEGEEVEEIKAELNSGAKRQNLIVMMKTMVSSNIFWCFRIWFDGKILNLMLSNTSALWFFSAPAAPKRELEEADGPAAKVAKTENGS